MPWTPPLSASQSEWPVVEDPGISAPILDRRQQKNVLIGLLVIPKRVRDPCRLLEGLSAWRHEAGG